MKYKELFQTENEQIRERYELAMDRISDILEENMEKKEAADYFLCAARFILKMDVCLQEALDDEHEQSLLEMEVENQALYEELVNHYEDSYANPAYACGKLGEVYGPLLSFLYAELWGMIAFAHECRMTDMTILCELFIQIYNIFEDEEMKSEGEVKKALYWFVSDYADVTVDYRIRELVDPKLSFATDIVMNSDLTDLRYLYRYGEYITENEIKTAEYLNSLPKEELQKLADTYTEGYRMGFINTGKDLSKKGTVDIRYHIGFEQIIRLAIENFRKMGLEPVIYRRAQNRINKRQNLIIGYCGAIPNKQFEYDHRMDDALFLDKDFVERKLGVVKTAFEKYKDEAQRMAGPACLDVFGEVPFLPENKEENLSLTKAQQKLLTNMQSSHARIVNRYIKGEERSFTIIAFPLPEIGPDYEAIFHDTAIINTLDQKAYGKAQQSLIDVLDKGDYVRVVGKGRNKTNLVVNLHELKDPQKETNFENCLADVNIPLGEVFTSPKLSGTNGFLHVEKVYLNELQYLDLEITFEDGMVKSYNCKNFDSEEENKSYILENVLFGHQTLPIGEFAIGTNTSAYVMAEKYDIVEKLPILIVEKMGPHFALGDTCYSWEEDIKTYNPDGKAIVARENEVSAQRKTDVRKAYFNCHTDITIPYDAIGEITVIEKDGTETPLIQNGRFVVPGTELLNEAFK